MKSGVLMLLVGACLFSGTANGDPDTRIWYDVVDLGTGRWEYTYDVENISLSVPILIEEFTIWFDYDLYDNLIVTTPATPAGWDQIFWDPEPVLLDDGAFDAETLGSGIGIGQIVGDFSVSFDWLGTNDPGSQLYHIVDPDNYPVPIETGYTIPEPGTLCLMGCGALFMFKRRRK